MTLFTYKVSRDFGFAPNPFWSLCTLACCKPGIRGIAKVDDFVVGLGTKTNDLSGKILYAMKVTEIVCFQKYWEDERFQLKKPNVSGGHKGFFGDNIYYWDTAVGEYRQVHSHHSNKDGSPSLHNLRKDTSADKVLISDRYMYFGANAVIPPSKLYDDLPGIFPDANRNFIKEHPEELRPRIERWLEDNFEWGLHGRPERWLNGAIDK